MPGKDAKGGAMKAETNIALRRFALRWLRKLVDLADDRLHAAEVRFRGIPLPVCVEPAESARPQRATVSCPYPFPQDELLRHRISRRAPRDRQPQFASKKKNRRSSVLTGARKRMTAAEFDLKFVTR